MLASAPQDQDDGGGGHQDQGDDDGVPCLGRDPPQSCEGERDPAERTGEAVELATEPTGVLLVYDASVLDDFDSPVLTVKVCFDPLRRSWAR